jgi:hypothetical protein
VGVDYVNRILSPAIQESVKASTAQFTAEELITKVLPLFDVVKETIADCSKSTPFTKNIKLLTLIGVMV